VAPGAMAIVYSTGSGDEHAAKTIVRVAPINFFQRGFNGLAP
jgi:hypothetical protein